MPTPPIVLLGGNVNALSVARSMARDGVAVHALGEAGVPSPVRHSRYVSSFLPVSDSAGVHDEWHRWLVSGPEGAVLVPCGDLGVEFIAMHREELVRLGYAPTEANDEISMAVLDKARTYALAEKIGIEVPRTMCAASEEELDDAAATIGFPCALKPLVSHVASRAVAAKAFTVSDRRELVDRWHDLQRVGVDVLVTEIVPGAEASYCSYYSYLDAEGAPLVHLTKRKLRQYPPGFGWGCLHETAWEPDAAELGLRFMQGAGIRGHAFVEFKRDERDGRLRLIECNPRLSAATELVRRAGVDFARLAYERAIGKDGPRFDGFRNGVHEWYPLDDTRTCFRLWREGQMSLRSWVTPLAPPLGLPIFDPMDIGPSLANARRRARRLLSARARRRSSVGVARGARRGK